jgi:hypothetical protein
MTEAAATSEDAGMITRLHYVQSSLVYHAPSNTLDGSEIELWGVAQTRASTASDLQPPPTHAVCYFHRRGQSDKGHPPYHPGKQPSAGTASHPLIPLRVYHAT